MSFKMSFIKNIFSSIYRKNLQRQKKRSIEQYLVELREIDKMSKVLTDTISNNTIPQIIQHKEFELCYYQASLKLLIKYPKVDIDINIIAETGHNIHLIHKEIKKLKYDYDNDIKECEELLAHLNERIKEIQQNIDVSNC